MESFTLKNKLIALCAKRNSGKTVLLKYLVNREKNKFSKIFVISPTAKLNHEYDEITCPCCIYPEYNEEWMMTLITKLKNYKEKNTVLKNVLLILDDCISEKDFENSRALKTIATTGRHFNLSLILTQQHITSVPFIFRNNLDYILCGTMNAHSQDILEEEFRVGNVSKKEFLSLYNENTKDYNFFVINLNNTKNNDINSLYGKLKVPNEFV